MTDETQTQSAATQPGRAVLVTTSNRGVFFGYAEDTDGDVIKLKSARNCIYWSKETGGFLGLAGKGPQANCKIGERGDIELRGITAVAECTPEAVQAWEAYAVWGKAA